MHIKKLIFLAIFSSTLLFSQGENMKLTSLNFQNKETIPEKYTCEGESISPQLTWEDYPKETKSFVLIMDDPNAVGEVWNHWIIYDIPLHTTSIKEGEAEPVGTKMGETTNHKKSYVAPCPPKGSGVHNYTFEIYALDIELLKPKDLNKSAIQKTMNGHILSEAILIGQVEKKNRFFFF